MNVQKKLPFVYTTAVIASLAAGASTTQTITFDQDSRFQWIKTSYFVDVGVGAPFTDSARPIPLITVSINDSGSSRSLNSAAIPIDAFATGKSGEPYILPIARDISPNSTLVFTFINYASAQTYTNLYFMLHGIKTYK